MKVKVKKCPHLFQPPYLVKIQNLTPFSHFPFPSLVLETSFRVKEENIVALPQSTLAGVCVCI